ncbi:MAG: murein biosynthesis integral membrane protein MurJ [Rhodocyclaceae bacterium]|nr:murein biosynthesis integral membrane protein MurJ [Rhodocyclaceae bacterium]
MNLLRALGTVSSLTLVSRVLGFVRDWVIARSFGAGMATDAFFVAFRLPNLLRRMFAEGAFSQAFVPILAEYQRQQSPEETRTLISRVATLLGLVVLGISILGMIFTPFIIWLTAPGFAADADKFALTVSLTRITFPYIFFMSLVALAGGILNTWSRFAIPAFTPALLNIAFIAMSLFAAPYFDEPVRALAWAVIIGGVLQLVVQFWPLVKMGLLPRFDFAPADAAVRRIATLMLPAMLGVSVAQISLVINTVFASFLQSGSVSWLYYADRLMEFPAGLLGAALGTILLPGLAKRHADGDQSGFSRLLDHGLRLALLLTLPAALALALLGTPLLSTLFQHGAFSGDDVRQTHAALIAYSFGLPGLIAVKILAPGFYARQDIRTPTRFAIISLCATQAMNALFVFGLPRLGLPAHAGLALSIGLASLLNASLLARGLLRRGDYTPQTGWRVFLLRIALALLALAAVLVWGAGDTDAWLAAATRQRVLHLCWLVPAGIGVYFAALFALGFRLRDFRRA